MTHDTPHHHFQRARSDAQKQDRRREILSAAHAHLVEVGLNGFATGPLAEAAGIARGTLYLYFSTREEVLLALYLEEVQAWLHELETIVTMDMAVEDFLGAVFTTATRRTVLMELAPRVTNVFEGDVSAESLMQSKRIAAEFVEIAGRLTSMALRRPAAQGAVLATGLFAVLIGVCQTMHFPDAQIVMPERQSPDNQEYESTRDAFIRIGRWMLEGSRGNT